MAAHGIHKDVEAVLSAGCEECEWRAKNLLIALEDVARDLRGGFPEGLMWDANGNAVGSWSLTLPEHDLEAERQ